MIKREAFHRTFVVRRIGDIARLLHTSDVAELPVQSMLHILDNLDVYDNISRIPSLDNSLMQLQPAAKRIIISGTTIQEDDLLAPDSSNLTIRVTGLQKELMDFRQAHGRTIRFVAEPQGRTNMQDVVSYNHLFNARITGRFQHKRLFDYVMAVVLNTAIRYPDTYHIIHIPLKQMEFVRTDFTKQYGGIDPKKTIFAETMQYWFMLHLLSFVVESSSISMFNAIPVPVQQNITLACSHGDRVVFYNLGALAELMLKSSGLDIKLLNQLNMLTKDRQTDSVTTAPVATYDVDRTAIERAHTLSETAHRLQSDLQYDLKLPKSGGLEELQYAHSIAPSDTLAKAIEYLQTHDEVPITKDISEAVAVAAKVVETAPPMNVTGLSTTGSMLDGALASQQKKDLENRDNAAFERINQDTVKSMAQRRRLKSVVTAYRTLTFPGPDGDTSLLSLLEQPPVSQLDKNNLSFLEGEISDSSMLESTAFNLDQQYLERQFQRDLARTIMSFPDMHITNINRERVDDPLNRLDTYVVTFVDEELVQHTLRFTLPIIDDAGMTKINGVEKAMTKQKVNTPICKVSDHRVSLASNFNKTLVERHSAVAYSFYAQFAKWLSKGNFETTYASCYPFAAHDSIPFPPDEHNALSKRIAAGKHIFTLRGDEDYEKYNNAEVWLLDSPFGLLEVVNRTTISSVSKYQYVKLLTAAQKQTLTKYDKILVLELAPARIPSTLAYHYTTIARKLHTIKGHGLDLTFAYHNRFAAVSMEEREALERIELAMGTYIGTAAGGREVCFIMFDGRVSTLEAGTFTPINFTNLLDLVGNAADLPPKPLTEWLELKILNKSVPVGFALCYRYGLLPMLQYLRVPYELHEANARVPAPGCGDVVLRFKDRKIIIRNARYLPRVIFSGLNYYNLSNYLLEDMDQQDVYHAMVTSRGMSTHYLKGIDDFFLLFIDPLTEDVLRQMGEPTNTRDLLIRAAVLLTSEEYLPPAAISNSVIRSYSRINAAVYNEMARAYSTFKHGAAQTTGKFSMNPQAVFQKLLADQLMVNTDTINPVHELKRACLISHVGDGGRSADTFMLADRQFTEDSIGVISEATVDSGKVGINASLSVNPNLQTLTGIAKGVPPNEVTPSQLLSVTGLLLPGVTSDDGKRAKRNWLLCAKA